MPRNALWRGLSALIRELEPHPQDKPTATTTGAAAAVAAVPVSSRPFEYDIDLIDPSPYQPRTRFREESLDELARSIRSSGIIQPLVLRAVGTRFQLIAGERRWRVAQRAGLQRVPAVLRDVPEELALEITLVENIQREDLNPIEQATAFDRLMSEFGLTQEDVAERTAKDRATVANAIRLLRLERPILDLIEEGKLSAGHGRALLAITEPKLRLRIARRAARGGLTVRHIERMASQLLRTTGAQPPASIDANTRAALEELQRHLGTRVTLRPRVGNLPGQLMIEYYDETQLAGLYDRLMRV